MGSERRRIAALTKRFEVEKVLAIEGPPSALATAWLTHAQLLRERDPARALELAKQAREHMPEKNNYADEREAVRVLIAELEAG